MSMIYEYKATKHFVVIEWSRLAHWGENTELKWVASCHGATLAHGPTAEAVLDTLVEGRGHKTLDGLCPSNIGLPPKLDTWMNSRG